MSYPSLSVLGTGTTPFFDGLVNSKMVTSNVFTFSLASTGSTLYLGAVDPAAISPIYVNVPSNSGYWTVSNSSINGIQTSSIVDTGTSLIVAPVAFAKSFFKAVNATLALQSVVSSMALILATLLQRLFIILVAFHKLSRLPPLQLEMPV